MATKLTEAEIAKELTGLLGWQRRGDEITRQYKFSSFTAAMAFVNHAADLAESMDHHPDILVHFNKVTLTLSRTPRRKGHREGGPCSCDERPLLSTGTRIACQRRPAAAGRSVQVLHSNRGDAVVQPAVVAGAAHQLQVGRVGGDIQSLTVEVAVTVDRRAPAGRHLDR